MRRTSLLTRVLILLAGISVISSSTLVAQHVRYKTKTKMEIESLGFLGRLLNTELKEETSISGMVKRVDRKDNSTITNLETLEIINLNHKKKEYSVITIDEMMEMFKAATSYAEVSVEEGRAEMESDEDVPEYKVEFDLRVEDTGKEKKIGGHKTYQKVLIIETLFTPVDEAAADTLPSTSLYAINDLWLATDVPEMAVNDDFNRKLGEIMKQELTQGNMSAIISALLKSDPRVAEAMDKAKGAMEELEGTTLLSVMHVVTVPPDMELDLALALGEKEKPKKKGGGFGGFMKAAAKAQGIDVGDDEEQEKVPEQTTLFSMTSKTESISDKARKPEYYMVPDDYEEIEFELPKVMEALNAGQ